MHITNLLIDGTRVSTSFTIMALNDGPGQWVLTPDGAFRVIHVRGRLHDKWSGVFHDFAEVERMEVAEIPPLAPSRARDYHHDRLRSRAESFFGTQQERDNYWRRAWNS